MYDFRPPLPAASHPDKRPPPRSRREVETLLGTQASPAGPSLAVEPPLRVLLVSGPKDHGPGEHDYAWFQQTWAQLLSLARGVEVEQASLWPSSEAWAAADVVVCYFWCHDWDDAKYADLDRFLGRGGGLVCLHAAIIDNDGPDRLAERIGLAGSRPWLQYRHGPLALDFGEAAEHAVCRGLGRVELVDEIYWRFTGDVDHVDVLATARHDGQRLPQIWTYEGAGGRVFCSVPGHYCWTFADPLFRAVLLRAIAWSGRRPVDCLTHLAPLGAAISPSD